MRAWMTDVAAKDALNDFAQEFAGRCHHGTHWEDLVEFLKAWTMTMESDKTMATMAELRAENERLRRIILDAAVSKLTLEVER